VNNTKSEFFQDIDLRKHGLNLLRSPFFVALDAEFEKAVLTGVDILNVMDANTK
jgi:hypothetical protein